MDLCCRLCCDVSRRTSADVDAYIEPIALHNARGGRDDEDARQSGTTALDVLVSARLAAALAEEAKVRQ